MRTKIAGSGLIIMVLLSISSSISSSLYLIVLLTIISYFAMTLKTKRKCKSSSISGDFCQIEICGDDSCSGNGACEDDLLAQTIVCTCNEGFSGMDYRYLILNVSLPVVNISAIERFN